jgi:hypothetical protein
VNLDSDIVVLRPAAVAALPCTATGVIGPQLAAQPGTAQRLALLSGFTPVQREKPGRVHSA